MCLRRASKSHCRGALRIKVRTKRALDGMIGIYLGFGELLNEGVQERVGIFVIDTWELVRLRWTCKWV